MHSSPRNGSRRTLLALAGSILLAVAATSATATSGEDNLAARFDLHTRHMAGGAVVVVPRALESLNPYDGLRAGWEEFETRHGGGCEAVTGYSAEAFRATPYLWLQMIPAEDHTEYNIAHHFEEAVAFLQQCKQSGGIALLHCNLGINRSGAIAASASFMSPA